MDIAGTIGEILGTSIATFLMSLPAILMTRLGLKNFGYHNLRFPFLNFFFFLLLFWVVVYLFGGSVSSTVSVVVAGITIIAFLLAFVFGLVSLIVRKINTKN